MKREILYTMKMPYRQDFLLEGFRFGEGEKSCAVVGGIRGDVHLRASCKSAGGNRAARKFAAGARNTRHSLCQPLFHERWQTLLADGWQRH